ncbi:hypothetical protein LB465_06430 [Salegentibacter sp. LM13S]|uniref:DUF6660 family protein n=1 Tax=Salegentibacter lacus TaxID=2873599 RepID=UPI001CC91C10|nr:DUF6660 family protein [Salegentibacter lacus]MBZ9630412.1 hypothetical protein [Salegentibacter lacus]
MKIIAVILSIYVLGLNFVACSDNYSALNGDTEITEVNFQDLNSDHSHEQTADLCPPFCSCHCCHVHTINFSSSEFQPLTYTISSDIFLHFDSLGKEIPDSFLQPPRV